MNAPGEKSFKALWRQLSKDGWKARKLRGLNVDFTYVKPGVVGKLDSAKRGEKELMTFARRAGLLKHSAHPQEQTAATADVPEREAAVMTSAQLEEELHVGCPAATRTVESSLPAPSAPASSTADSPSVAVPVSSAVNTPSAVAATIPDADVQTDYPLQNMATTNRAEEETKNEDENDFSGVDLFDTDYFMDALRSERLFGPVAPDDVNISDDLALGDDDGEDGEDDALDAPPTPVDYESDVESDDDFEDDSNEFWQDDIAMRGLQWRVLDQSHCGELQLDGAGDLYSGSYGVTKSAAAFAKSPMGMFFYFLPKTLWVHIATESNEFRIECIPAVANNIRRKQLAAQAKDPRKTVQPLEDIVAKLERVKPIKPHEVIHVIGLLAARTLCSHKDGLEKHWSTREDGAVPRGTFGRYMKRDRFRTITRYLHFVRNSAGSATHDKAWKVRPILQVLDKTFRRGYRLGSRVSFDEGTIPNRSQFNPIRVYNKDKPHKYGTKCYMTCCAETGYCARVEVYLGGESNKRKAKGVAQKAVIRNVAKVFDGIPGKRLIIADNFYSSCALTLKLLEKGFYYVGTLRSDRLGWPTALPFAQKSRPKGMHRGTYRIAQAVQHPELVAVAWMDSSPVHLVAAGCSTKQTAVKRRNKTTGAVELVPCSQLVADYHAGMGGVDTHDQLRLQSYSLQRCVAFKKYYRQLFLGFVDMALVNGFIIHKLVMKNCGQHVPTHAEYIRRLHRELMGVSAVTFEANMNAEEFVTAPIPAATHRLRNNTSKYRRKRRQHSCKVCSAMADSNTKSFESSFYCPICKQQRGGYVPLCAKVRREETGNTLTCSQIWHTVWGCGTLIPVHLQKNIRCRKRKHADSDGEESEEEEDHTLTTWTEEKTAVTKGTITKFTV